MFTCTHAQRTHPSIISGAIHRAGGGLTQNERIHHVITGEAAAHFISLFLGPKSPTERTADARDFPKRCDDILVPSDQGRGGSKKGSVKVTSRLTHASVELKDEDSGGEADARW